MKLFGRYRSDFINFIAMVAFFALTFALNGLLSEDANKSIEAANADLSEPETTANTDGETIPKENVVQAKESADDSIKVIAVPAEKNTEVPVVVEKAAVDSQEIKTEELADATKRVRADDPVASDKAVNSKTTDVALKSEKIVTSKNKISEPPLNNPIKAALEDKPTQEDMKYSIDELDNETSRRQYMAANKGLKVQPIVDEGTTSSATNLGRPIVQDSNNEDFIPFEKTSNTR